MNEHKNDKSNFSIHETKDFKDDKLNPLYGMEIYSMSDEDIEALKNGMILYTSINCDEYAIVIGLSSTIDNMRGD